METIFDKPLDKKVASLNDHIATLRSDMSYWTLHPASNSITNNYASYTLRQSRNFNDYEMITIAPEEGGWLRNGVVIPVSIFKYWTGVALYYHSGSNVIEIDVKYKSDTQYDAKYIGSPSGTVTVNIYGILRKSS